MHIQCVLCIIIICQLVNLFSCYFNVCINCVYYSIQGDAVVSTQQQPSIDNGTPQVKIPSYKDYIDIWIQLMDPGKLQVMIGIVYDIHEHLNL